MITASLPSSLDAAAVRECIGTRADVDLLKWDLDRPLSPSQAAATDAVVLPFHTLSPDPNPGYIGQAQLAKLHSASAAQLVQLLSLGSEGVAEYLPIHARLCNAKGTMEEATAELACALILAAQRDIPQFASASMWSNHRTPGLAAQRILLLGVGGVGTAIERRLKPFGPSLSLVGRHERQHEGTHVHGSADLAKLAATTDILVCSLPLSDRTLGMVSSDVLAALPNGALVVNVGRGPVVDTEALLPHLRTGRLRAALDVVDPEPLPGGHELWSLDGALITPHVGGNTSLMPVLLTRLVADQLVRLATGHTPINTVREPS